MKDTLVIAIVIGFFAVCAAYVIWCERVLTADSPERVAGRRHSEAVMFATSDPSGSTVDNWIGLGLAVLIVLYLIGVLVFPEKF